MKKTIVLFLIVLAVAGGTGLVAQADGQIPEAEDPFAQDEPVVTFERGKVLEVETYHMEGEYDYDYQLASVYVESGRYKGETVEIENVLSENVAYNIEVETGDRVILMVEVYEAFTEMYISDHYRNGVLKIMVALFLGLLVLVGGRKGLKSVITISLTILLIFKVMLPGILKGWDPLLTAILVSSFITVVTILIITGFRKKSYAAIIGTVSGVVIAGLIAVAAGKVVKLTGMSADEASMLLYIPQQIEFDFRNLLFAGILLGALGAVMDIAMSIASAIQEIHQANRKLKRKRLFRAGMEIGKDVMGTMSNTLILAYTGSSIPLLLILMAYETPFGSLTNMDIVATEIVRSLAGSIGLILTIPITAFVSVVMLKKKRPAAGPEERSERRDDADERRIRHE